MPDQPQSACPPPGSRLIDGRRTLQQFFESRPTRHATPGIYGALHHQPQLSGVRLKKAMWTNDRTAPLTKTLKRTSTERKTPVARWSDHPRNVRAARLSMRSTRFQLSNVRPTRLGRRPVCMGWEGCGGNSSRAADQLDGQAANTRRCAREKAAYEPPFPVSAISITHLHQTIRGNIEGAGGTVRTACVAIPVSRPGGERTTVVSSAYVRTAAPSPGLSGGNSCCCASGGNTDASADGTSAISVCPPVLSTRNSRDAYGRQWPANPRLSAFDRDRYAALLRPAE